ncbi:ATP-binding cassette transporter YOR1 [Ephemerocybe angulata]|uniref:ATP-binding cassette transporter YOR1 n=1 Tax=Ephemerocybe angulata TaxID=980116 RepID=A0A8H6M8V5_9AGAR|nr:ATP-binding cassette transporter YOR1 [Tulosesus angulatus]
MSKLEKISVDDLEKSRTQDSDESTRSGSPTANAEATERSWYTRVPFTTNKNPPPPKGSVDEAELTPEAGASWISLITFDWLTPLLALGYARPLEAPDLFRLQDERSAAAIAAKIDASYERQQRLASEYNQRLAAGEVKPGLRKLWWMIGPGSATDKERNWREVTGKKKASLVWAMNDSIKWWFWSSAALKVVSDVAQVTSPLVVKAIIRFANESYFGHRTGSNDIPSIGVGIGLSICLLLMQVIATVCAHHFIYRAASTGVLIRGGLITAIYTRALRLTSRARSKLPNGKLVNHISTDVSRIDFCATWFHMGWASLIQLAICLALLIVQIGPSALAGFAVFIVSMPIQTVVMKRLFNLRKDSMVWTDRRAKLLQELLGGMKVIKFFAWEVPFLNRIEGYRAKEMGYIRSILLTRAGMNAYGQGLPALASVIAFVTYSATGHILEPSVIFTALTLFNLLRLPLLFLPMSLGSISDAFSAIERLSVVFEAELLEDTHVVDPGLDVAVRVEKASFTWDAPAPEDEGNDKKRVASKKDARKDAKPGARDKDGIFQITDVDLSIPRGMLVAIVGPVGSGKTSLLQGIIGEMRQTSGTVTFGGDVGFCPQSAWIQNATIRENICFGRPFEHERYWKAIKDCCLERDLDMLPNGDMTEVGEKGISLSGGQKQRINICRTIYCDTPIQIFDDPLSALDAHVGKAVFENVLRDSLKLEGKSRILITHTLHFLPQVDYIYTIYDGRIVEQGTYNELMTTGKEFAKFISQFGSQEEQKGAVKDEIEQDAIEEVDLKKAGEAVSPKERETAKAGPALMQEEERNTGSVSWDMYKVYARAGKGKITIPLISFSLLMVPGTMVMSSYWLVWWQQSEWNKSQGFYMGIYAALGLSQVVAAFAMSAFFALLTYFTSRSLHRDSIRTVMHAPMSFFETTPLGRIMNRFSKDIDTIDNVLGEALRMCLGTAANILGIVVLVSVVLPWFLIGMAVLSIAYVWAAIFYLASAREFKRLDSILRSSLYSHFSESLSGLATIRAYKESGRFKLENQRRIDIENRAYWMTVVNQHWLGIRLDAPGGLLVFIVAILAVGTRFTISPAQTGLVLSYILTVQQSFGWLVRQTAEVENNMNAVERMDHYANRIEQEAPHEIPETKPPPSWPERGRVELSGIVLSYRPGLPPVLKGLSMSVNAGEKIGIVGRTGAGKSSLMTALYRIVELSSGSIFIDDIDIAKIGLTDLRSHLAIIPQEPLLFSGTIRSNLDPFNQHNDATLWDALKRSYLTGNQPHAGEKVTPEEDEPPSGAHTPVNKFTLDSVIEDEGGNLSIGQRSLVSLARALVKNARIIILDEATASVDYETDRNIQDTISHEFKDRTILCIAHRLRTIISYDRICVLDAGQIAEFDTPVKLFHKSNGIFRGMCDRSSITLDDIRGAIAEEKDD